MTIVDEVRPESSSLSCNTFNGRFSEFHVVAFNVGNVEPTTYQLNFISTTATTATVQAVGVDALIREGMRLTNSAGEFFIFGEDATVLTSGTSVLSGTRSTTFTTPDTVSYYDNLEAIAVTAIDYAANDTTVSRNLVGSLITESFRKSYALSSPVSLIADKSDTGLWTILFKAWKNGQKIRLFTSRAADGRTVTGDAIITNFTDTLALGGLSNLSFQVLWNDFQDFAPFSQLTTTEQLALNAQRTLFTLPEVV